MKSSKLVLLSAIFAFSCGGNDEKKGSSLDATPAKVNPKLLIAPSSLTPKNQTELRNFLEEGDFFAYSPNKFLKKLNIFNVMKNQKNDFMPCYDESDIRIQATRENLKIKQNVDISACIKKIVASNLPDQVEVVTTVASIDIDTEWRCPTGDLSFFNDRQLANLGSLEQNLEGACPETYYAYMKIQLILEVELQAGQETSKISEEFTQTLSTPGGKECTYQNENDILTVNNCVVTKKEYSSFISDEESHEEKNFTKILALNLKKKANNSSLFFESGQHQIQFNNWTGSVKHYSNHFDFDMTNTNGETIKDSLGTE